MPTENNKDYEAIKNIALHQNEEKEHTQELARAVLASLKHQGREDLLTSDILNETLPKSDHVHHRQNQQEHTNQPTASQTNKKSVNTNPH